MENGKVVVRTDEQLSDLTNPVYKLDLDGVKELLYIIESDLYNELLLHICEKSSHDF